MDAKSWKALRDLFGWTDERARQELGPCPRNKPCRSLGSINKQYKRTKSGKLNGPYYYWFWRENGRLRKLYLWGPGGPGHEFAKQVLAKDRERRSEGKSLSAGRRAKILREMRQHIWNVEGGWSPDPNRFGPYRNRWKV